MAKLSSMQAMARFQQIAPYLGKKDQWRVHTLLLMAEETGEINLARALHALAPGKPRKIRIAALQRLCDRVEDASMRSGVLLLLRFNKGKAPKRGIDNLQCWFEGDIEAGELAQRHAARATKRAATRKSKAKFEGGKVINYFVMWSQDSEARRLGKDFLKRLQRHLNYAKHFHFVEWSAENIDIGANWHDQIQQAITESDLALLLISPEFLGSNYIKEFELPNYVASDGSTPEGDKMAIPVALMPFNRDSNRSELLGLEHRQIFFGNSGGKAIAYSQCRSSSARDEFALELATRILQLLERKFGS
jgi:hypothetical protein